MTNIDPAIVEAVLRDHRGTAARFCATCDWNPALEGVQGWREMHDADLTRLHQADALAPLIAAAVDAARAEGERRVRERVEAVIRGIEAATEQEAMPGSLVAEGMRVVIDSIRAEVGDPR